jgi:hypothetical protein
MMMAIREVFVYFGQDEVIKASLCGKDVVLLAVFQII